MYLPGYLEICDPVNGNIVLVDNQSAANMAKRFTGWAVNECVDCVCPSASCNYDDPIQTPWYSPTIPGSTEFFGLFGQLRVSQPAASTLVTSVGSTVVAPLKRLTFVGLLVASTARGVAYGSEWVQNALEPLCASCVGRTATVYKWCPDQLCDTDPGSVVPEPVNYDFGSVVGLDGCTEPVPLAPAGDLPVLVDSGERTLVKVSYIPGSFADVDDLDELAPCYGRRVTFSFTVDSGESLGPPDAVTVGGSPAVHPCCENLSWEVEEPADDCGCVSPCGCSVSTVDPYPTLSTPLPDGATDCQYSTPWCARQYAMLVGPVSASNGVPIVELTAGDVPLENVSITTWHAVTGLPSPSTPSGAAIYEGRAPVTDPALIHYVGPNSTLILDGGEQAEYVDCPGEPSNRFADVVRCGQRPYQHPLMCCGSRYWVVLEMPCDEQMSESGWELKVTVRGVEGI